eukprot:3547798-Prymnesium_polylepis.1
MRPVRTTDYYSGRWHHDGCGHRLKCFVYLSAVGADAHPTRIVRGSHSTVYYWYGRLGPRFTQRYVDREFAGRVDEMLGEIGE